MIPPYRAITGEELDTRIEQHLTGTISLGTGALSATATIELDANQLLRAALSPVGNTGDSGSAIAQAVFGRLTVTLDLTTNTITVTRGLSGGTDAVVVGYDLTVYVEGTVVVTRGTISLTNAAAAGTATVAPLDIARTRLTMLGWRCSDLTGENSARCCPRLEVTNLTTITATRLAASSGGGISISAVYQIEEEP